MTLSFYKTYETTGHRIIVLENGILHLYAKPTIIDIEACKEVLEKIEEISEQPYHFIIDPTEDKSFPIDARKYTFKWMNDNNAVVAAIIKNKSNKLIYDFMTTVLTPKFKHKSFTNLEDAQAWITEQKKSVSGS